MIVPDWVWRRWGHHWLSPFDASRVNPVSVDLTLSPRILLQRYRGIEFNDQPAFVSNVYHGSVPSWLRLVPREGDADRPRFPSGDVTTTWPFQPGDSVLARTQEVVRLPRWMRAQGMLKSSLAREGINHRTALYIDPGFHGPITLEINFDRSGYLIPKQPVIQIEGQVGLPHRPYDGHYQRVLDPNGYPIPNRNGLIAFEAAQHDLRSVLRYGPNPTEPTQIELDSEDSRRVSEALADPPEPNALLRVLMRERVRAHQREGSE